jgi:hypothetical protein
MNKKDKKTKNCFDDFSEANFVISPDSNYENSDEEIISINKAYIPKPSKKKLRFDNPNENSPSPVENEKSEKLIGKKRKNEILMPNESKQPNKAEITESLRKCEKIEINKITNKINVVKTQKSEFNFKSTEKDCSNIFSENNLKEPVKKIKEVQEKEDFEVRIIL